MIQSIKHLKKKILIKIVNQKEKKIYILIYKIQEEKDKLYNNIKNIYNIL